MPKKLSIYEVRPDKIHKIKHWLGSLGHENCFMAQKSFEKMAAGREFGKIIEINGRTYAIFFKEKNGFFDGDEAIDNTNQSSKKNELASTDAARSHSTPRPCFMTQHQNIIRDCLRSPALSVTAPDYDLTDNLW